jgi:tricarballylate dehydrogenase
MEFKSKLKADIVVMGGGNAGLVAAIEARNQGATVLLLEKGPKHKRGGNSRVSGGHFRVAWEKGTEDLKYVLQGATLPTEEIVAEPYTRAKFYADLMKLTEGLAEQKWAERIVNESKPIVEWMWDQGLIWGLNTTGQVTRRNGKIIWPSGTPVLTAGGSGGESLVEQLFEIAAAKGTSILYETAARSLVQNADGHVCGVIIQSRDGMHQIDTKSVIMACGGFEGSPEMRRQYLGEGWDLVKLRGTRYNTGDGLRMAIEIGAQACGHWGGCHASVVSEDSPQIEAETVGAIRYSYCNSIMINTEGKRFVDEGEHFIAYTYAKYGKQIAKQPGGVAYQIFDKKVMDILRPEYVNAVRAESTTLEGLAEEIGVEPKTFVNTVKEYNSAIVPGIKFDSSKLDGLRTKGLNPDKTNWAHTIDTPPFVAYACVCGITFTYGGLKTDDKMQVLDTRDLPVEGLYAIGEMSGGVFYHNYPSGTGLVKGAIGGRIAASDAVARAKG